MNLYVETQNYITMNTRFLLKSTALPVSVGVILLCCKPRAKSDFIQFYALFLGNPDPLAQSRLFRKGDDCPPSQKSRGISSVTFHRDAKQAYMVFRATSGLTQLIFYKRT